MKSIDLKLRHFNSTHELLVEFRHEDELHGMVAKVDDLHKNGDGYYSSNGNEFHVMLKELQLVLRFKSGAIRYEKSIRKESAREIWLELQEKGFQVV